MRNMIGDVIKLNVFGTVNNEGMIIGQTMDKTAWIVYKLSQQPLTNIPDDGFMLLNEEIDIRFKNHYLDKSRLTIVDKYRVIKTNAINEWEFTPKENNGLLLEGDYVSFVVWVLEKGIAIPVPTTGIIVKKEDATNYTVKILTGYYSNWGIDASLPNDHGYYTICSDEVVVMGNFYDFADILDKEYPKEGKIGAIVYDKYKCQYGTILSELDKDYSALVAFPLPNGRELFSKEKISVQHDELKNEYSNMPCYYWVLQEDLEWIDAGCDFMFNKVKIQMDKFKLDLEAITHPSFRELDEEMKVMGIDINKDQLLKEIEEEKNYSLYDDILPSLAYELTEKEKEEIDKIYHNKPYTIVILKSGVKGITKCQDCDTYDYNIGLYIAFCRAKMEEYRRKIRMLD